MKPIQFCGVLAATIATGLLASGSASGQILVNGGFESGLSGWTAMDQAGSDGTFAIQSGTVSPVNGFTVPAPPAGAQAAMTDSGAGGSHILFQDFQVPVGVSSANIQFSLFVNNGAGFFSPSTLDWAAANSAGGTNLNQQARVDILTTSADPFSVAGGDVLQNLYQTKPGDPAVSGYNGISGDLTNLFLAHGGETLRLRFAEADNVSFFNLGVDQAVITATAAVPEPSSLGICGTGLVMALTMRRRKRRG